MKGLSNIIRSTYNFLFSRTNREFLVFLFFFAVAGIFWLLMTLNESYEQELRIPIRYTNIPQTVVLTSSETDTIRVTVSDKGIVLLTYLYGDALKGITVDFNVYARQKSYGVVPASELAKKVTQRLAASTRITSVKPDKLTFFYNYGEKKKVPIRWKGNVTPEDLYFISNVEYSPDSVTIYASREKLDSITTIYTEAINQSKFRDTLIVNTRLRKISGVKIVPEEVTVKFRTDVLTEESIDDIPIVGINMPEGMILRTFPTKVSVRFVAGVKTYRNLSANDFTVVADYNEFKNSGSPKCTIYLQKVPEGISRATLSLKQVDYLIEEQVQ